jgi:hypothetical protein
MANRLPTRHLFAWVLGLAIFIEPCAVTPAAADVLITKLCWQQLKSWRRKAGHKAFAVSQPVKNKQVCGVSWKADSKRYAITAALKECRQAAVHNKLRNPRCQILESQ